MFTSTTQTAISALIAAVKQDLGPQAPTYTNVNIMHQPDGSTVVGISAGIPVSNTNPTGTGQVALNYTIPAA
jgi:hypothetical protein